MRTSCKPPATEGGAPVRPGRLLLHTRWFDGREEEAILGVAGRALERMAT